jgi:hypothetical protein
MAFRGIVRKIPSGIERNTPLNTSADSLSLSQKKKTEENNRQKIKNEP